MVEKTSQRGAGSDRSSRMRWAEEISREEWGKIDQVIDKYREKHGALIPVLKEVQDICGYLPKKVQHRISQGLHLPSSQVYGVVSFYTFFNNPKGKTHYPSVSWNSLLCERIETDFRQSPERTQCGSWRDHTGSKIFFGSGAMPWCLRFSSGFGRRP